MMTLIDLSLFIYVSLKDMLVISWYLTMGTRKRRILRRVERDTEKVKMARNALWREKERLRLERLRMENGG